MAKSTTPQRAAQRRRAELEQKLRDLATRENSLKESIYKLEASIVAAPSYMAAERLRMWNAVPADDERVHRPKAARTRVQRKMANRTRSREAMTALVFVALALALGLWFVKALTLYGIL
jgi:predicted  nucleic acid-binding Zn-ribbon protein